MKLKPRKKDDNGNGNIDKKKPKNYQLEVKGQLTSKVSLADPIHITGYDMIRILVESGLTRPQIGEVLGIKDRTLDDWVSSDDKLKEIVLTARRNADLKVVNSLFRRACGYNFVEVIYDKYGREVRKHFRHLPPDVTACIFWLKNRMKDEWQDKFHGELTLRDRMDLGSKNMPTK